MSTCNNMDFSNQANCLNCGDCLAASFCGNCGQKKAQRITFKNFMILLQRGTLEFRSPLLKTIIGLTLRPADTCREYLDGRRINYFNPARYAFWLITFTMLLASFFNVNLAELSIENYKVESENIELFDKIKVMIQNSMLYFFFVSAFVMALISKLVFRKEKYNLFELYVVYLLLNGHLTFISIGLLAMQQYGNMYGQIMMMIMGIAYPAIVIARIYTNTNAWTYIKSFSALIIGWLVASLLLALVAGFAAGYVAGLIENNHEDKSIPAVQQINPK